MKTKVEITATAMDYNYGETGYIDGYILSNGQPCAIVVFERRISPVPLKHLIPAGIFDNEPIITGEAWPTPRTH